MTIDQQTWTEINYFTELLKQEGDARLLTCVEALLGELRALDAQVGEARETIKRLNRRAQRAEAGVRDNVEACRRAGVSFGRMLANSAATMYEHHLRACADTISDVVASVQSEADISEDALDRWTAVLAETQRILPLAPRATIRPPLGHPDAR